MTTRIAIERVIVGAEAERMLACHRKAFTHLDPLAVEPQSLPDELFLSLLASPDVLEFTARAEDGYPTALIMSTPDLDLIPWIQPTFYARRYPEHYARDAVFYVPCLQIDPDFRGGPLLHAIIETFALYIGGHRGIIAFDTCQWDIDNVAVPQFIERIGTMTVDAVCEEIDSQRYYGFNVTAIKEIDLRDRTDQGITIDHRVPESADPVTHDGDRETGSRR